MLFNTSPILTILAQPFLIALSGSILGWQCYLFYEVSNVQYLEASNVGQCSLQRPIPLCHISTSRKDGVYQMKNQVFI